MPISEDLAPASRRRMLLKRGHDAEWWRYESENEPGYTGDDGVTYAGVTYTIKLPESPDDEQDGSQGDEGEDDFTFQRVLLAAEVEGYVLGTAEQYGPEAIQEIRYRPGL